jgi:hypothetical protein
MLQFVDIIIIQHPPPHHCLSAHSKFTPVSIWYCRNICQYKQHNYGHTWWYTVCVAVMAIAIHIAVETVVCSIYHSGGDTLVQDY